MRALASVLSCLLLVGCGTLLPSSNQRSQSAQESSKAVASQSQTLKKVVEGNKPPEIKIGGWGNTVEFAGRLPDERPVVGVDVPYRESVQYQSSLATDNHATSEADFWSKSTIPMGVNLMLLAAGILAVLFAVRIARNSSAAANVAFQTADAGLASLIRSLRDRASTSTDPARIADYQTQIAELESQRGRLSR